MTPPALLRLTALCLAPLAALAAPVEHPATLAGHAILPADTLLPAPPDAPGALQSTGKFTGPGNSRRTNAPTDGAGFPFRGQPVQGFSAIEALGQGTYLVLTDNGFGSKANSADAMLSVSVVRPDFATGTVELLHRTFLSDPDHVVPFPIAMEGSDSRYLTGADFDPESFRIIGEHLVIGEEFGPFILVVDRATGRLTELHDTLADGQPVISPDHPGLQLPNPGGARPAVTLPRSRGFEGMARAPDGAHLYPLLEGPLRDADRGTVETLPDGRTALRLLEMAAATRGWTGRSWLYPLEHPRHAIGDFTLLGATRGLVIERDGGQGDAARACTGAQTSGCFDRPAGFKRIYLIDFAGLPPGQAVRKLAYIDLLAIRDPNGLARQGGSGGRFTFPFVTVESVERVDAGHIIVGNDNNFPYSRGRDPEARDDSEFILLEVTDFLAAGSE